MTTYYVDTAAGNDTTGTGASGSPWATLGKAATSVAAGDTVYVKASGTYNELVTLSVSGTEAAPITWIGYTSTITDGGVVTINGAGHAASLDLASCPYNVFRNFLLTGGTARSLQWANPAGNTVLTRIQFDKPAQPGTGFNNLNANTNGCFFNNVQVIDSTVGNGIAGEFVGCVFYKTSGAIVKTASYSAALKRFHRCLFFGGAIAFDGSSASISNTCPPFSECSFIGSTGDAIKVHGAGGGATLISNCLFASNAGYDINVQNTPTNGTQIILLNNGYYNPGTAHTNGVVVWAGNEIQITANPFAAGTNAYGLNTNNPGGGQARGVGFPGAFPGLPNTTGYLDLGAVQSQGTGGTTTNVIVIEEIEDA